jgi:anti-anti-sigma factor
LLAGSGVSIAYVECRVVGTGTGVLVVRRLSRYRCEHFILDGELDAESSPWLAHTASAVCTDPQVDVVILDLQAVTFLSAAGLACLDQLAAEARRHEVWVSLWNPRPVVRRVLDAAPLDPSIMVVTPHEPRS